MCGIVAGLGDDMRLFGLSRLTSAGALPLAFDLQLDGALFPRLPEYLPMEHGFGAAELARQYPPAVHGSHAVRPVLDWYRPTAHAVQDVDDGRA